MPTYSDILSTAGRVASGASATSSALNSIFGSNANDSNPNSIRGLYTNGFIGSTANFAPNYFSRLFDQPTYLTFRIEFDFNTDMIENIAAGASTRYGVNSFDFFPHPFLSIGQDSYFDSYRKSRTYAMLDTTEDASGLARYQPTRLVDTWVGGLAGQNYPFEKAFRGSYSTYNYLRDTLGEDQRADMLKVFITALRDIQDHYPYYFTEIDGLGDLLKVEPSAGIRIKDNEGTITIKCYDGIDQKITQLSQLYRKIVWDDVYQRWILPDIMRFFKMRIYVSEIRLFHSASKSISQARKSRLYDLANMLNVTSYDEAKNGFDTLTTIDNILNTATAVSTRFLGTDSTLTNILEGANQTLDTVQGMVGSIGSDFSYLCNNAINDVMPTWCIECNQCEFMIDDTANHINSLFSYTNKQPLEPTIKIKVGQVKEAQAYPLNAHLKTTESKYTMLSDGDMPDSYMSGSYFTDDELMRVSHVNTNSSYADRANKFKDAAKITETIKRINPDLAASSNDDAELRYRINRSSGDTALLQIVQGVLNQFTPSDVLSAATSLSEITNFTINSDMIRSSATSEEQRRKLSEATVLSTLVELSNSKATSETAVGALASAIIDNLPTLRSTATDPNYNIEESIQQPDYISTATERDEDIEPSIEQPDYYSTATEQADSIEESIQQPDYISTATERDKDIEPSIEQPDYYSTATEQTDSVESDLNQYEYESNATNENYFIEPSIKQPDYISTATERDEDIEPSIKQPDYISTATERDEDIEPSIKQPDYYSTATEQADFVETDMNQYEYVSTATVDSHSIEPSIEQPDYISTAIEQADSLEKFIQQPDYISTATEKDEDIESSIEQPDYYSTATEQAKPLKQEISQPTYNSTATERNDAVEPSIEQPEYQSTATKQTDIKNNLQSVHYSSTATDNSKTIETSLDNPNFKSTATEMTQEMKFDMQQTDYTSQATSSSTEIDSNTEPTAYVSTATTENKIESNTQSTDYKSTATNKNTINIDLEKTNYISKATNEDNEIKSEIASFEYKSTAASSEKDITTNIEQTEYISTATSEDNKLKSDMSATEYESSATNNNLNITADIEKAEYQSGATKKDNKITAELSESEYKSNTTNMSRITNNIIARPENFSTATSQKRITRGLERLQGYSSTATENDIRKTNLEPTEYSSSATDKNNKMTSGTARTDYSSSATDKNNKITSGTERLHNSSMATNDRKITSFPGFDFLNK